MNDSVYQLSVPNNDLCAVKSTLGFPVVGIGASAGGIGALTQFIENIPANSGMAFVIVLHPSSTRESSAAQLLERTARMKIIQVTTATLIEANHVYVIAPHQQLAMNDGHLLVSPAKRSRSQHSAIDVFFRTLADVHQERAIAVVLSGAGADGAVGISRIKEQGGLTLAQLPADAENGGMPLAAISTGVIDFVLPAVDIPRKLMELWASAKNIILPQLNDGDELEVIKPEPGEAVEAEEALQSVISVLRADTGHDFRHYKRATILRRVERRMQVREVSTLPAYLAVLESDPTENTALLKDMLIGVTHFFRDRYAFNSLELDVLPDLFASRVPGEQVRVWVTACATGEEAYSVAILLTEQAKLLNEVPTIQVFASDVDEHALAVARSGAYPTSITADVTPARLRHFFTKVNERYHVRKDIRDSVLFAAHNLLRDPPFSKLDIVTCRNLLIYLTRDAQLRLLKMFHSVLKPGGLLFLGNSESAEGVSDFFVAVDKKNRIYRARAISKSTHLIPPLPASGILERLALQGPSKESAKRYHSYAELHQRSLANDSPPSVILDGKHDILHTSENAVQFFRFAGGEPSRNVLDVVLPALRTELSTALYQAEQTGTGGNAVPVVIPSIGGAMAVQIKAKAITDATTGEQVILVKFEYAAHSIEAVTAPVDCRPDDDALKELEAELKRTRIRLQETTRHAEVSTEEIRLSNEELQAINEELRSATDELETSREELQSINEELLTVNYELKLNVDEISKANDDLNNLIASTNIATVFVDRETAIKRFTPRAVDIFSIIDSDIGRSLLDLSSQLDYGELASDIADTFNNLQAIEREVRQHNGSYYIVRLQPYRTKQDKIEGAVITFFDVSARRQAEERVRQGEERMRLVADSTRDYAIITVDVESRVTSWNKGAEIIFGYHENEILGNLWDVLFTPEDRDRGVPAAEKERARTVGRAEDERWHLRKDGSRFYCSGITTPLKSDSLYGYAKIARDQTERIERERELELAHNQDQLSRVNAESANAVKDEFLAIMSHELRHPLNMININAELLSRMPCVKLAPASAKAVSVIRASVVSQSKIIEDLLDMSRLNTGKLALNRTVVDLSDLVKSIVDVAVDDPAALDLQINIATPEEPIFVDVDVVRIEQIVLNLLSNAIKFTNPGGRIFVDLSEENERAKIVVRDDGKGIPVEFLPHVFDLFGQDGAMTPRASKAGLGIGLALVKQIAELHGGQVQANSSGLGLGAKFTVWLPLAQDHASPMQDETANGNVLRGLRVVVVDDAEDMLLVFKTLLELDGAIVQTAFNASDGLTLILETNAQLLVSDISMPGVSGYDFIREVRKNPTLADLPAIALTGLGRDEDITRALEAGYSDHLCKPVSFDALYAKISALMRK